MVENLNIMSVNVKWSKTNFPDVQVDLDGTVAAFRAQLCCLSSVPMDKMKINVKGYHLKDGDDIAKIFTAKKIEAGSKLIQVIGTAVEGEADRCKLLAKAPAKKAII